MLDKQYFPETTIQVFYAFEIFNVTAPNILKLLLGKYNIM